MYRNNDKKILFQSKSLKRKYYIRIYSLHATLAIKTAYNPRYVIPDKKLFTGAGPFLNFLQITLGYLPF